MFERCLVPKNSYQKSKHLPFQLFNDLIDYSISKLLHNHRKINKHEDSKKWDDWPYQDNCSFFADEISMNFFGTFFDIKRHLKKHFHDSLMYNFLKKDLFKSTLETLL